ncbi:MAG: hypothetical protein Q9220_003880 [cf. Caloplaca sp. 1 TL-2023]
MGFLRNLAILNVFIFSSLVAARPQISDATSPNPTVFYHWSDDPACDSKACRADCRAAATAVCDSAAPLSRTLNVTVGECTALMYYATGNTVPTKESCYSAFTYINDAGKPKTPDGCGGTVGGALGYDKDGKRTIDPLFALYPKGGNGNCFKAPGDTSPPKAANELTNGDKLPWGSCPNAARLRKRNALQRLERRDDEDGIVECVVADAVWQVSCNAVCLEWVTATTWWSGPFMAAGWLACIGGCDYTGWEVFQNCRKSNKHDKSKRATAVGQAGQTSVTQSDPCTNLFDFGFQCPAWQQALLKSYKCPGTDEAGDGQVAAPAAGSGSINT